MAHPSQRPKVGLALSGGGARALAHIGVLKVLEREGIPVDLLAGTSMGGIIAAGYAAGLAAETMAEEACRMGHLRKMVKLLDRSLLNGVGLFGGQKVQQYLASHLGDITFDELPIPLALVAVDLEGGQEVILRSGSVVEALRATISVPGVFTPFRLDGHLLVDGGVLNNLPADVVRRMGADVVIGVDSSSLDFGEPSPLLKADGQRFPLTQIPLIIEALRRTVAIMEASICAQKLAEARPEVLIRPSLDDDITIFGGFFRAAECIAAGEEAAQAALPHIREQLESCSTSTQMNRARHHE